MKVLLDENFPLSLHRRLREKGYDTEFEQLADDIRAQVIISRLPQRLPTAQRVDIWMKALETFLERKPEGRLFDLMPSGEIVAWEIRPLPRENR